MTREVHTHHVYHRILPVQNFEVLPPKHFIQTEDGGLEEIPLEDAAKFPVTAVSSITPVHQSSIKDDEPNKKQIPPEPILADKTKYVLQSGKERTEYLWRYPPVFEDAHGRTQPVRIPAGLSDAWKEKNESMGSINEQCYVQVGPRGTQANEERREDIAALHSMAVSIAANCQDGNETETIPEQSADNDVPTSSEANLKTLAGVGLIQTDGPSAQLRREAYEKPSDMLLKRE